MRSPPATIGKLPVLAYTPIDDRRMFTGNNERRWVDGTGAELLYGPVAAFAICRELSGISVILIGCDEDWQPIWQTACSGQGTAFEQAEFEYEGVSRTWLQLPD